MRGDRSKPLSLSLGQIESEHLISLKKHLTNFNDSQKTLEAQAQPLDLICLVHQARWRGQAPSAKDVPACLPW